MYRLDVVREPARPQRRTAANLVAATYRYRFEVADGGLHSTAMIDRHAQHAGNRSGETHLASVRCVHFGSDRNCEVDAPVPCVPTIRSEVRNDRAGHGGDQPDATQRRAGACGNQQQCGKHERRHHLHTPLPLPPRQRTAPDRHEEEGREVALPTLSGPSPGRRPAGVSSVHVRT
jgi:hypothetical protein